MHQLARFVALLAEHVGVGQQGAFLAAQVLVLLLQAMGGLLRLRQLALGVEQPGRQLAGLLAGVLAGLMRVVARLGNALVGQAGEGQVVGRHGPADFGAKAPAGGLLQGGGRDGQLDPGVVAVQQQHEGAAGPAAGLRLDALARSGQQGLRVAGLPLPQHGAAGVLQLQAVQGQKAGPVGRVELERGRYLRRQREAKRLPLGANGAAGGELAALVKALGAAQVELAGEQGLRRQLRLGLGHDQGLARRRGVRGDDELVGQRVGQGQQVAGDGGGQGVEGDVELGVGQLALHRIHVVHGPARLGQHAQQGAAGEKAQVGLVQQAFGTVAEFARHQLGQQADVAGVGDGQQGVSALGQQGAALGQHVLGVADVLEHVGADDDVVGGGGEQGGEVGAFEVGDFDAAVVGRGQFGLLRADRQAVDGAGAAAGGQVAADGAAAAAQVEHARAAGDAGGQHRQRGALGGVDFALVDVQGRGCGIHEKSSGWRPSGTGARKALDATMVPIFCALEEAGRARRAPR